MELLIEACLLKIENELERLFWNKNQKELDSPFRNTGNTYKNNTFEVNAYWWDYNNDNPSPNFIYGNLEVRWYKHLGRNLTYMWYGNGDITAEFLATMLEECIESLKKDFNENEEYYE